MRKGQRWERTGAARVESSSGGWKGDLEGLGRRWARKKRGFQGLRKEVGKKVGLQRLRKEQWWMGTGLKRVRKKVGKKGGCKG